MYPRTYVSTTPDKVAARLIDTGEEVTYAQLDERSTRLARVLHDAGLRRGDVVALLSNNDLRCFEVYWAAMRTGLYITAVNHHLSPEEMAYIVNDSGAKALVAAGAKGDLAEAIVELTPDVSLRLAFGGEVAGHGSYADALAGASAEPLDDEPSGAPMLYSSGTTGRPKGVRPPLPERQVYEPGELVVGLAGPVFGMDSDTVYLSPAPIYHAAPLRWCGAVQAIGGTVIMTEKFDAERTLAAIAENQVTAAQFVPTMFVRMLKLDDDVRTSYDVSSLKLAIHAAAPCPVDVKQKMIDWWGPVLVEYYAGTEGHGMTMINSANWLKKPGSVGQAVVGVLHICDEDNGGKEQPVGEVGTIYFERDEMPFSYHNDPEKTREAQHPDHPNWSTVGDIGRVDEDGFLFLTDRKSFTIISGGVNIYPQEIENVLALHEAVTDVAVIGVPDPEMGEAVKAFIQPAPGANPGPELEKEIIDFVRSKIARFKAPRSVQFVDDLPRTPTGKLVKHELKRQYVTGG
ncbi:acyl-CoA synthetase [Pseudonocardia spinosispora]|uniref:acyl-CoA synthetase n=1 Tax=Pseudonocardia spinosispora TaxID=103441 RepID=UPI000421182F|nr:acyl-CoA synthetase [Pseudonocardia spinosispora]